MFHSAGTGMDAQVPEVGGVVGSPVVGRKSQVPSSEASTVPLAGRGPGPDRGFAEPAAYAVRGSAAAARAAPLVVRILRRVKAGVWWDTADP